MHTFYQMWNVTSPQEALGRLEGQRRTFGMEGPRNLEEQAISLVGRDIYDKLIRGYTEKQWGRPCTELPVSIIKRIPVRFTFNNNYFNDKYQGIPEGAIMPLSMRCLKMWSVVYAVTILTIGLHLKILQTESYIRGQ